MKQTWKTINNIIGRGKKQQTQSKFKTDSDRNISDPQDICNCFNDFFVNVGPNLASKIQRSGKEYFDYFKNPISDCMFMKPIVETEIIKIIDKFNQNKSAGNDNIGNFVIKRVA
jgi:hypothetical protein